MIQKVFSYHLLPLSSASRKSFPFSKLKCFASTSATSIASLSSFFETPISVRQAHEIAQKWLRERDIEDPEESSRYFLSHLSEIGGYRYSDFTRSLNKELSKESIHLFINMLRERATFKPIQYIIGNWDFCRHTFFCRPPVLIPRPETEEMVEFATEDIRSVQSTDPISVLDIGCGSGVIGISLLLRFKNVYMTCLDQSKAAIDLTEENAARLLNEDQLQRFKCYHTDYVSFINNHLENHRNFDFILSNPPYIPSREMATLQKEVRLFEDRMALDGGKDGLDLASPIIDTCSILLKEKGSRIVWLELSREHPEYLSREFSSSKQFSLQPINDFTGHPRFVKLHYHL